MINGLHHVAIVTDDIDRLRPFYTDILGFEVAAEGGWKDAPDIDDIVGLKGSATRMAMLRAGNLYIEMFEYTAPDPANGPRQRNANERGYTHFCLDVTDCRGEYERLTKAGMTFHSPPKVFRGGEVITTYGRDPDGNIIEIQELCGQASPVLFRDLKVGPSSI